MIESVATNPIDPAPGQSYVFEAAVRCVDIDAGMSVTLDIVGTDNYQDETTCFPSSLGDFLCTLYVPGASQDGRDVVTATINPPKGYSHCLLKKGLPVSSCPWTSLRIDCVVLQ